MMLSVGKWAAYWYQRLTPCTIRYQITDIYGGFKAFQGMSALSTMYAYSICKPTIKNKSVYETQKRPM